MISPGQPWGNLVELDGDEPRAHDDRGLAELLARHPGARVLLDGGDLFTSLGGQAPAEPFEMPIDLLEVTADGRQHLAAAHVVARRRGWRGHFVVAMNGTHLGGWNLGPKAHPNDGIVDLTSGSLGLGDRLKARRRAPAGAHLPHPDLTTSRRRSLELHLATATPLFIDGVKVGRVSHLVIAVRGDAGRIVLAPPVRAGSSAGPVQST